MNIYRKIRFPFILSLICVMSVLISLESCNSEKNIQYKVLNDFESYSDWGFNHEQIEKGQGYSGFYYCKTDIAKPYGIGMKLMKEDLDKFKTKHYRISGWIKCSVAGLAGALVSTFEYDGNIINWNGIELEKQLKEANKWTFVSGEFPVPDKLPGRTEFKFFLWNKGSETLLIDDMEVVFME